MIFTKLQGVPSRSWGQRLALCAALVASLPGKPAVGQQTEGDQFLDGIGETALVARYLLAGNVQDSSRNQSHATLHGAADSFGDDPQFGRVLVLKGDDGPFVTLPGKMLIGFDSLSVAGWVQLESDAPWQRFFDFGQGTEAHLFCTPLGAEAEEGFRARITDSGWASEQGPVAPRPPLRRWVHLAVVLDASQQTLAVYADGKLLSSEGDVELTLENVLDQQDGAKNQLWIGKSSYASDPTLTGRLHDLRIYSIPLSAEQVATIHRNALPEEIASATEEANRVPAAEQSMEPTVPADRLALDLVEVPPISVETVVGSLPRLPLEVPAMYRADANGSTVRVIWPAPTDNSQVLQPGTYEVLGSIPGSELRPRATVAVVAAASTAPDGPERTLETFPLGAVVLTPDTEGRETPFMRNRDKFVYGLLATNPDNFLYMFRDAFGQQQPQGARPLGVWDSQTTRLRGHASGHYLSAIAQAYASASYDPELQAKFATKMDYLIGSLYELSQLAGQPTEAGGPHNADPTQVPPGPGKQEYDSDLSEEGIRTDYWNWGAGFISAYPPDQFIMLEQGASYGGRNNQIWAPYYTLHKILAGLLDCYEVGGNEKGLEVARGMGLWVHARLSLLPDETRIQMWNRYIAGEYGGMNEVMARLYRVTGDERFLECAKLFDNIDFFFGNAERSHGLARNVDTIRGKHANQHIPQITGALETYRSTADPRYYEVANNFWHMCTGSYMYAIGGVAGASTPNNAECFTAEPDSLFQNGFSEGGQNETCATYNLLKLSRQLFLYDPQAKYIDYYEQALYNHILASVDEDNPGNTYHVPLNPGSRKRFGNALLDGFTCCNGTAIESSTKLQNTIYFRSHDNQSLYVNLFVPSQLHWKERNLMVTQETSFPYSDRTRLKIEGEGPLRLQLRIPRWATAGATVWINGSEETVVARPGQYLTLDREWVAGDVVELRLPMEFHLSRIMDQPNIASLFYGPVLLAGEEPSSRSDWRQVKLPPGNPGEAITGDPAALRFQLGELRLKPFFETYGRYSVYLDVVEP
jgi:uncharacterized protein